MFHRLPMAQAAKRAGYVVHVITHVNKDGTAIKALGFCLHPMVWQWGGVSPLSFLANVRVVRQLYQTIAPDLVHHVALRPFIVGTLAATGLPCVCLNALAGLGYTFTSATLKSRLVRTILR